MTAGVASSRSRRWAAMNTPSRLGGHFKSWRHDLGRWVQAEDIALSLRIGAESGRQGQSARYRRGRRVDWLTRRAAELTGDQDMEQRRQLGLDEELAQKMFRHADRTLALSYGKTLGVVVDDERARFSTWYEMFPRSCSPVARQARHVQGLRVLVAAPRRHGFRCVVLPADPSGWAHEPQGQEQHADPWPG
jgi:starch synthase (maltosyl-transferring)